jgi:hypothetical protein
MGFLRITNRGPGVGAGPFVFVLGGRRRRRQQHRAPAKPEPTKTDYRERFITDVVRTLADDVSVGEEFDLATEVSPSARRRYALAVRDGELGEAAWVLHRALVAVQGDTLATHRDLARRARRLRRRARRVVTYRRQLAAELRRQERQRVALTPAGLVPGTALPPLQPLPPLRALEPPRPLPPPV